jgi:hypothetical protein
VPSPTRSPALFALASALFALAPGAARAGAFDVLGAGPEGVAEINARAARADDGFAGYLNPGGLGFGDGVRLTAAPMVGGSLLRAQGRTLGLTDPFGFALAFDATVPFEGFLRDRVRVGFAGYFPPSSAFHLLTKAPEAPLFPAYDNRTQRLVLTPALAVRVHETLSLGLALDVLGGVRGPAVVTQGASGANEPRIELTAATALSVHAGLRFDPRPGVRLALAFRQRFSAPAAIDSSAVIAGVPLTVDVTAPSALFDPTTIVAAGSFDLGRATVELDAVYQAWSAYHGPWVTVHATLPGVDITSAHPTSPARDTVSLRAAFAYRLLADARADLALRAGAGFEPSMLKRDPQGETNLVDGDKLLLGLGASLALPVRSVTLRFALGANLQRVFPFTQDKRACTAAPCPADTVTGPDAAHPGQGITNPGYPTLSGQGAFLAFAAGVGVSL